VNLRDRLAELGHLAPAGELAEPHPPRPEVATGHHGCDDSTVSDDSREEVNQMSKSTQIIKGDPSAPEFRMSKPELKAAATGRGKAAQAAQAELDRRAHNKQVKQASKKAA